MLEEILVKLKEEQANNKEAGTEAALELNWDTLDISYQQLAALISLFALAPIPLSLLESAVEANHLEIDVVAGCNALVERYLLRSAGKDAYQLHERVRDWLRDKLEGSDNSEDLKRGFCKAIAAIARKIPQALTLEDAANFAPVIPHLAEVATEQQQWLTNDDLIWPFVGLGRFYQAQGSYEQAQPWWVQCVTVARTRLGDRHPDVATSLNNLAGLYSSQGRYELAEPLYEEALDLSKELPGDRHLAVATSLNNLAGLYSSQGRYELAEPLYEEALDLSKELPGDRHLAVSTNLNNLALLYLVVLKK